MNNELGKNGFSLTEVLLAVGTLAIGMIFIGGTYFTGIHFATLATERTMAAVVADEAFAKVRIFGINVGVLASDQQTPYWGMAYSEFAYPSTRGNPDDKQYCWSALCRLTEPREPNNPNPPVQVTVFVCRKVGTNTRYRNPSNPPASFFDINVSLSYPVPVKVGVSAVPGAGNENKLTINMSRPPPAEETFINDGYTIVENTTGQIYRVVRRDPDAPDKIELDRPWNPEGRYPDPDFVWVIPPPLGGGRYPCIAVYQKVVGF